MKGLEFFTENIIVESCGWYGRSKIRLWDVETAQEISRFDLLSSDFAEGLTIVGNNILMLTWKEKKLYWFTVDENYNLKKEKTLRFPFEGWGLVYDKGRDLLYSTSGDGRIHHFKLDTDKKTISHQKSIRILNRKFPELEKPLVSGANELEFSETEDMIFANVIGSPFIIGINPVTGEVLRASTFEHLDEFLRSINDPVSNQRVMNGIAIRPGRFDEVFVTGKNWRKLYILSQQEVFGKDESINISTSRLYGFF